MSQHVDCRLNELHASQHVSTCLQACPNKQHQWSTSSFKHARKMLLCSYLLQKPCPTRLEPSGRNNKATDFVCSTTTCAWLGTYSLFQAGRNNDYSISSGQYMSYSAARNHPSQTPGLQEVKLLREPEA